MLALFSFVLLFFQQDAELAARILLDQGQVILLSDLGFIDGRGHSSEPKQNTEDKHNTMWNILEEVTWFTESIWLAQLHLQYLT